MNTHGLTDLGYKILIDRYALKDMTRQSLETGNIVIAILKSDGSDIGQKRELGTVVSIDGEMATVRLYPSDEEIILPIAHLDIPLETTPEEIRERVARGIASVEKEEIRQEWQDKFDWIMDDWKFVPGGRILAAAGTDQKLSYFNCYMVGEIPDARGGIIERLADMAEIMSRGGGAGINISSLRPRNAYVKGVNGRSSGAVSWGGLYSFVTGLIEQGGSRRGALLILINDWHPDVLEFIHSKREAGKIENANISVGISDAFMNAVKYDGDWVFYFPDTSHPDYDELWNGDIDEWCRITSEQNLQAGNGREPDLIYYGMPTEDPTDWDGKSIVPHGDPIPARMIWNTIVESAWASAEPGLIFIERFNKLSNSYYYPEGRIIGTNPCSEIGLPAWANCNLGAINYSKFWDADKRDIKWDILRDTVRYAVRFLDNVIDVTYNFDERITKQQFLERRIGLGAMGIGELLIKAGIRYGSDESVEFLDKLFGFVSTNAYVMSARIGGEKGAFPAYNKDKYLESGYFTESIDEWARKYIENAIDINGGMRNVVLLTVQPTGTTGTLCNTSTGIEPFFSWAYYRQGRLGLHEERVQVVQDWLKQNPNKSIDDLPNYFANAMDLTPEEHVKVQAVVQKWVDQSISKTCNLPEDYTVEETADIYMLLYDLGCKGGTVYRQNSRNEQVLSLKEDDDTAKTGSNGTSMKLNYNSNGVINHIPNRLDATVLRGQTPYGKVYITISEHEHGMPLEVFITIGKSGSDLLAQAETIGRLLSVGLQSHPNGGRLSYFKEVVKQMRGIGGSRAIGLGPNRVSSFSDAVGKIIEEQYLNGKENGAAPMVYEKEKTSETIGADETVRWETSFTNDGYITSTDGMTTLMGDDKSRFALPYAELCPECNNFTLIRADGCQKCETCGYSVC